MRDPKISLDINKTRQIAQEIIKVKGCRCPACLCQGQGDGLVSPLSWGTSRVGPHLLPSIRVLSIWSRELETRLAADLDWSGSSAALSKDRWPEFESWSHQLCDFGQVV